ncbi:MAG TPA: TlpA disulfide reductase family protein [Bacteroidales bacterium]|nr:TlpA disulfide reductase family protein [Bacteroidales bacterium]
MKRILFLLALILTISGCKDKGSFYVNGVIKGENKYKYIYINRLDINTPILIDSSKINKRGGFRFKVKISEPDFYQAGVSSNNFITLLAEPGENIKLVFSGKNLFEDYSVNGSEGSEKLRKLDLVLTETKRKLDSLSAVYDKASEEPGFDLKGPSLEADFNKLIKEQRKNNIGFIINNLNSMASIKALYQRIDPDTYVLYDPKDLQYLKIVTDSLTHHYPNSKHVQALARDFEKEMNQMYMSQLEHIAKGMPQTELDPDLKSVTGKKIALSSLKGKYVLLTFWSIRSRECITENLQLKEYYKMYNKKGFEIYQINLDESEADWKAAVSFDELPWISTREDDPLNPKNAILFNVKKLPTNYLFDKNGKIIATNLHGRSLKLKLEQLFIN